MVLSKDLKIAICFGLIVGSIISILTVFGYCSDYELITPIRVDNINLSDNNSDGVFIEEVGTCFYVPIEPGYEYKVEFVSSSGRVLCFSNYIPEVDVPYYNPTIFREGDILTFNGGSFKYLFVDGMSTNFRFYRRELEGMTSFVDNIAYSLSIADLSSIFVLVVPILAISVLVGLGVYFIRRIINKTKKTKGGI